MHSLVNWHERLHVSGVICISGSGGCDGKLPEMKLARGQTFGVIEEVIALEKVDKLMNSVATRPCIPAYVSHLSNEATF